MLAKQTEKEPLETASKSDIGLSNVRYAVLNGSYILKFEGDIRVTLCASLDAFISKIFQDSALVGILVDLNDATNIDSTALGIIAKISARSIKELDCKPTILSSSADINRILECMGLGQVFNIVHRIDHKALGALVIKDMPKSDHTQKEMCEKVLEAHRELMALNDHNKEVFKQLVCGLEKEQRSQV